MKFGVNVPSFNSVNTCADADCLIDLAAYGDNDQGPEPGYPVPAFVLLVDT